MAGLRTKTVGIYEKDTGRHIVCNVEGYPYSLIWSAPAKPVRFVCIEPWQSLPGAETTRRTGTSVLLRPALPRRGVGHDLEHYL